MKRSFIFLHIAVLLGGITGIFGKLITVNAASLVWFRVAISAILLYLILKFTRKLKHYSRKEVFRLCASSVSARRSSPMANPIPGARGPPIASESPS